MAPEKADDDGEMTSATVTKHWNPSFLSSPPEHSSTTALIILNQPFSEPLLKQLWFSCSWRSCADGGANRLYDAFSEDTQRSQFLPDLIKGDFDSIRQDVKSYYSRMGVVVVHDMDQNSTDLQKCLVGLAEIEKSSQQQYTVLLLGGLSGRLDQTIHTLSLLHKLRKSRPHVYAITEENVGWVLDSGEHVINIDLNKLGPTCGLLPVGIDETTLSTRGLEWDLNDDLSSFDGLVSTSNHVVAQEVFIKTSKPIWWCVERKTNRDEARGVQILTRPDGTISRIA